MHYDLLIDDKVQTTRSEVQNVKIHSFKTVKNKIILDLLNKNYELLVLRQSLNVK